MKPNGKSAIAKAYYDVNCDGKVGVTSLSIGPNADGIMQIGKLIIEQED